VRGAPLAQMITRAPITGPVRTLDRYTVNKKSNKTAISVIFTNKKLDWRISWLKKCL
jgi:Na+-translocating ferredoxin:NAD+ oxidoreductase RnfC subunit